MGYQESLIRPLGKGFTFNNFIKDIESIYKSEVENSGSHLDQCNYAILTFKKSYYDIKKDSKFLLIFGERWVQSNFSYLSNKETLEQYSDKELDNISEYEIFKYGAVKPKDRNKIINYYDKYCTNIDHRWLEEFSDIIKTKQKQDEYWDIKYINFNGETFE